MSSQTTMMVPQGTFELRRIPDRPKSPLRAWDAADEYLLKHLAAEVPTVDVKGGMLVVNDLFGALTVALTVSSSAAQSDASPDLGPQSWGDSVTSHRAMSANLDRNGIGEEAMTAVPSASEPIGPVDLVLIKVPRSLALLEDQLRRLRPLLHAGSHIIGGGMVKQIHRSTLDLFEQIIGPSPTSLAKKKARLIHPAFDQTLDVAPSPFPTSYDLPPGRWPSDRSVFEHANVFSQGRLDIGTRAMLDHLPPMEAGSHVLDLGCGNGLLGLVAASGNQIGSLTMVDESYQAVASALANAERWALDCPVEAVVDHTLSGIETSSMDLVLNNPPFHTHQSRGDDTARSMFADAHRVLRPGGSLIVVGNRHLDYHHQLKRRFESVDVLGSNPKFVVLQAIR